MSGIFHHTDAAFRPFRDDTIVVRGTRPDGNIAVTLDACVFPGGLDDPLAEDNIATARDSITAVVSPAAWRYLAPPQVGDTIAYNSKKYAVAKVDSSLGDWRLDARETSL